MNNIILPFESRTIKCNYSLNEILQKLDPLLNNGLLFSTKKKLKAKKINDNKLLLETNLGFIINTQLFYIEKINSESIKIFSRNNIFMSVVYFILLIFGIIGITYSITIKETTTNIVIFCFWTLFVFIIGNGAKKIVRYSQIEEIESYLLIN